jgi:hypothetical protein
MSEDIEILRETFLKILEEVGFSLLKNEDRDEGFSILGTNKKRRSIWTMTILSLVSGYIPVKRTAVELSAKKRKNSVDAILRCMPYIDVVDMEATAETPQEQEICENLASMMEKIIFEKLPREDSLKS